MNLIKFKNNLFHIIFILAFIMPHTSAGRAVQGVLPLVLFWFTIDKTKFKMNLYTLIISILIIFSFSLGAFENEILETKSIFRLFSLMFLFLLFPFSTGYKIKNNVLYSIIVIIFLSQIAYAYNFSFLISIFDSVYPKDGLEKYQTTAFLLESAGDLSTIKDRRYGGIYFNPNQCVKFVSVLLIIFLIENKKQNLLKIVPFTLIIFISILLSGSRTGLVLFFVILVVNLILLRNLKPKKILFILCLLIVLVISFLSLSSHELRVFKVSDGVDDSLSSKFDFFFRYIEQVTSYSDLIFGHFSKENIHRYGMNLLDSEWAEIIYNFGFLGFLSFFIFYVYLYRTKYKNIQFSLLILIWGVTSTIISSYRMSFIFMLLLSIYYSRFLKTKQLKTNL